MINVISCCQIYIHSPGAEVRKINNKLRVTLIQLKSWLRAAAIQRIRDVCYGLFSLEYQKYPFLVTDAVTTFDNFVFNILIYVS